ncbi:DUF7507 domain-containing protein [Phytoactinopolyspora mesophila]|nr:GEVED domain-containing protein [Phytoactinopolyspora mesophila]
MAASMTVGVGWVATPTATATQTQQWTGDPLNSGQTTSEGGTTEVTFDIDSPVAWDPPPGGNMNRPLAEPPGGPNPYSPESMLGDNGLQLNAPGVQDAGTLTFTFSNPVANPIISVDRLGGAVHPNSNSARLTLLGGEEMVKLSGVDHLVVGQDGAGDHYFERIPGQETGGVENFSGDCRNNGEAPGETGTACGSIQLMGVFTEVTFKVDMVGQPGSGDALHLAWFWEQDLGDAPESYGRAIHAIHDPEGGVAGMSGPFLGPSRPTDDPMGDEFHPEADRDEFDDGVDEFPPLDPLMAGETYAVPVQIGDSGETGTVCGWIDWNQNGTFDEDEQVCATAASGETVELEWTIPEGLEAGDQLFARFRIASDADEVLSPTGAASDGEVEDYMFVVDPPPEIELVKSADTDELVAGETITYTFVATNTGEVGLDDVVITDTEFSGAGDLSELDCTPEQPASLAPGQTLECTATYEVQQADVDAGLVENSADVVGFSELTGTEVDDEDDEQVPSIQDPGISLVKTADPEIYSEVGETITYSFVATNTGNVTVDDVVISETAFDGDGDMSALVCVPEQPTELAPEEVLECTATYTVTQADIDAGEINNSADVVGADPDGVEVTDEDDAVVTAVQDPALEFEKFADPTLELGLGDVITYTFIAENTGNTTLTNVEIEEAAFSGSGEMSELECDPEQPATLAPGDTLECTATYTLTQADVDAGVVTNTACVTADGDVEECDDEEIPQPADPDIVLVKTAEPETYSEVGETITYTFVATNTGNVTLTDVVVSETAFDGDGEVSELVCDPEQPAALAPDETLECSASYTIAQADIDAGEINNSAEVVGTDPDGDQVSDDDEAVVTAVQDPALSLVKSSVEQEFDSVGDTITYSFIAENTGNVTLTDVVIEDTEFSGAGDLSELDCTPEQPATLAPGDTLNCTATYVIMQADLDAGGLTNAACVGDGELEECDEHDVPGIQDPALELVKSSQEQEFDAVGDVITYSFVATNTGNVTLDDVVIEDTEFSGAGDLSELECDPEQPASLAPGDTLECSATYTITQADIDSGEPLTNTACVSADGGIGECDDHDVPGPELDPGINLVKSSPDDELVVGETVTYTFIATNTGNVTLTDVVISEVGFDGAGEIVLDIDQPVTLAPGEQLVGTGSYVVQQADVDQGVITNVADVVGNTPQDEQVTDEDDEQIPGVQDPNLSLVKSSEEQEFDAVGDVITYTFVAENTGNVTLDGVGIAEDNFSGSGEVSELDCDPEQPASLAPSETLECTATYAITQFDLDAGIVLNAACATAEGDVESCDNHQVTGEQDPGLELVKSADSDELGVGDVITYSFIAENTGNVTLTDVVIEDTEFSGAGDLSELACDPEQPATLAPGETLECYATYTVLEADADAGEITNTAVVSGNDPDGESVTGTDDEDVSVVPDAPKPPDPPKPPDKPDPPKDPELPDTGSGLQTWLLLIGLALLFVGLSVAASTRREPQGTEEV